MVLPLPVLPRPSTSCPTSASGRVAVWIGNGSSMPRSTSAAIKGAGTPSSAKRAPRLVGVTVVMLGGFFVCVGRGCKDQQLAGITVRLKLCDGRCTRPRLHAFRNRRRTDYRHSPQNVRIIAGHTDHHRD